MRISQRARVVAVLCLAGVAGFLNHRAFADSFDIYRLYVSDGDVLNVGLTDNGSLTTSKFTNIPPSGFTYTTFTPPGTTTTSNSLPAFTFDNGSSCSVSVAGYTINSANEKCNNGREAFEGFATWSSTYGFYLFDNGVLQLLYGGPVSNILLDANGDVAFVGLNYSIDQDDTNYLYYDTSSRAAVTPEPSSIILLLTGGLGTVAAWRRRVRQA